MTKKQKYYVVWEGFNSGIYKSWEDCKIQINGHPSAKYKSFESLAEAEAAFTRSYYEFIKKGVAKSNVIKKHQNKSEIITDSIAVDAACSGNPGRMEYQCVETTSGKQIFHKGPFEDGTNNIGEFLGLVHAIALLHQKGNQHTSIYTDSETAISWVKNKKAKTKLENTDKNKIIFDLIQRAEHWLKENSFNNQIIKWNTESWGEIPADFGRK